MNTSSAVEQPEGPSDSAFDPMLISERTIDQRLWNLLLPQLFAIVIILSLIAGYSIFRHMRAQQHSAEFVAVCSEDMRLRVVYPQSLPVQFDDPRGLPLSLSLTPLDAPQSVVVRSSPPLEVRTNAGPSLATSVRLTPQHSTATLYLYHEPLQRAILREAHYAIWIEPPSVLECESPPPARWARWFGASSGSTDAPGGALQIDVTAQDQAEGYFYALISFLSNPEVWGGLVVGLVGGGLSLQLARQERRERKKAQRDQEEREHREQEHLREQRDKEKREAVTQQIAAIQAGVEQNVERGLLDFRQLASTLADNPTFATELDTLHDEIYSPRTFRRLVKRANKQCLQNDQEAVERTLSLVVNGFDPAMLGPGQSMLYQVAACNLDATRVPPIEAADAILDLWEQEQYEYYELLIRGMRHLWHVDAWGTDSEVEHHLRTRLSAGERLRDILRDTRLRALPTATEFQSPLPKYPLHDGGQEQGTERPAPYLKLLARTSEAGVARPREARRLLSNRATLIAVDHPHDKQLLSQFLHRESRRSWPVVVGFVPQEGELLADRTLLTHLCRALADAWLKLLKTVPTADLLMRDSAPLLSALLMWSYGGTTSGITHGLATTTPIVERGGGPRSSSSRAEHLLVKRLASHRSRASQVHPSKSTLQHWLTLVPYGYHRNLFILVDEGTDNQSAACWIDERELTRLGQRGCILKLVTQRPSFFRVSSDFIVVHAGWHPADITAALETVPTYPLTREIFSAAESRRWQDTFGGMSIENVIAEQADGSLGQAIATASQLLADSRQDDNMLTVESVRQRVG